MLLDLFAAVAIDGHSQLALSFGGAYSRFQGSPLKSPSFYNCSEAFALSYSCLASLSVAYSQTVC
jgi:hypothetical protein